MDLTKDIESVGREILDLMGASTFANKLLSITTEKGNDIVLDNFASKKYGWASNEGELPALYVMGLRDELIRDDGYGRWVWYKFAIEVYVSGDDPEQLERMINRYARAIDETLLAKYRDEGLRTSIDYSPVFKYEDSLFKVCSIAFQLKAFQDLR